MTRALFQIVFLDVDSTLVTIEGIDELAAGDERIAALTTSAMEGKLRFEDVYAERLNLLRPDRDAIERLSLRYLESFTDGARETVSSLKAAGVDVHIISGGIRQALLPLAAELDIRPAALHAVDLKFDADGRYEGYDQRSPLARSKGKRMAVLDVRARSHGKAAMIGDGITDLEAAGAVDLFIGFGGVVRRRAVEIASPVYIASASLTAALPYLLEDFA